jgi:hypothetical protein
MLLNLFQRLINNRQEQGQVIPWLDKSERFDVNLMLVSYHRANVIRKYQNLPLLEPMGDGPQLEESLENMSLEPADDTAGANPGMLM